MHAAGARLLELLGFTEVDTVTDVSGDTVRLTKAISDLIFVEG